VIETGQDVGEMSVQRLRRFDNRLQARVCRPEIPPSEKFLSAFRILVFPELPQCLLDGPCSTRLEVDSPQRRELLLLCFSPS